MMANLDTLITPDRPCHAILWVALMAFHRALLGRPCDPMVVATFCLAVNTGGCLFEAVKIARMSSNYNVHRFHELLESEDHDDDYVSNAAIDLGESAKFAMNEMIDRTSISKALASYPNAPHSDLVFIPHRVAKRVREMFDGVGRGKEKEYVSANRDGGGTYSRGLSSHHLPQIRHLFSRIVFDTIFPLPYHH